MRDMSELVVAKYGNLSVLTQIVQIDGIMSVFANMVCGVPQDSVLGIIQVCLYLLPLSAILRHRNVGYHIYAEDTHLYISFKCKDPLYSLTKLNVCISEIRMWIIKINVNFRFQK